MTSGAGRAAWLVEGDDPTLVAEAVRGVIDELVGTADRAFAVEDHGGDDTDLSAVADACRTPPFFTDRRVVVVREVGRFSTEEVAPLLEYLAEPLATSALVLAGGGGTVAPKLKAAVKATGHLVATSVGRDTKAWIRDRVRSSPVQLDGAALALLDAHLGDDVSRLGSILVVLASAFGEGAHLGPDDIAPYLGEQGGVAPWDLTDAIDRGQSAVALEHLHRMLGAGERHPLVVLATLARHVASMLKVDADDITSEAAAAAAMGIAKGRSTFPAKKALDGARRYGPAGIAEAISLVADAEVDLKGGSEWPGEYVLEVLVARLCRLARAGAGSRR